jgi:hypothetical protein
MPVGRDIERIPPYEHGARPLVLDDSQQEVGEANDRAGRLAADAFNRLGQTVVRPVGKRIAIHNEQWTARNGCLR